LFIGHQYFYTPYLSNGFYFFIGQGLGRHSQGMLDALKPKLKFDQAGIGNTNLTSLHLKFSSHVFCIEIDWFWRCIFICENIANCGVNPQLLISLL
jgi:hypothetical protein